MSIDTSQTEMQRERRMRGNEEQNTQELWSDYKRYNICVMGITEKETEKKKKEYLK